MTSIARDAHALQPGDDPPAVHPLQAKVDALLREEAAAQAEAAVREPAWREELRGAARHYYAIAFNLTLMDEPVRIVDGPSFQPFPVVLVDCGRFVLEYLQGTEADPLPPTWTARRPCTRCRVRSRSDRMVWHMTLYPDPEYALRTLAHYLRDTAADEGWVCAFCVTDQQAEVYR